MAVQSKFAAVLDGVGELANQKREEIEAQAAATRESFAHFGQQARVQAAAAILSVARNPNTPPGVARQAMRVAAQVSPKKAPVPKSSPAKAAPPSRAAASKVVSAPTIRERIDENLGRAGAFVNGAGDAATAGLGNHLAVIHQMKQGQWIGLNPIESYKHLLGLQEAQDQHDKEKYPVSRGAGAVVGTVAPLVLTGGASAAPQGFARIAPHAIKGVGWGARALLKRVGPQAGVSLASGGASAATQVSVDAVDPRRQVNPIDTASAFVGGMTGGLSTLYGGVRSGAVADAVATELTRAALRGERPSLEAMGQSAVAGSYLGKVGGDVARRWSQGLPSSKYYKRGYWISKEEIGEKLSEAKSRLQGERVIRPARPEKVSGGETRPDHASVDILSGPGAQALPRESKFGFYARLTKRQLEALEELVGYRVDHFTPDDVGKIGGGFLASIGGQAPPIDNR